MSPILLAAVEINERWRVCIDEIDLDPLDCPSNEEVAEIIEKYLPAIVKMSTSSEDSQ